MVIQRSWKILSESGSTSASSTEANRSPSGIHSSSDDSNCSNQTTHSMVTSVASPPAVKFEATSSSATTDNNNVSTSMTSVTETTPRNTNAMKYVTTPQMAETMLQRLRQRLSCPITGSGATSESAMRSLELLRISVQSAFDKEVDAIVKRFVETYFKPAFKNLKENLGQSAVSDDTLHKMSCALLENAKAQYNAFRVKAPQGVYPAVVSHVNTAAMEQQPMRVAIKRPATKPLGNTIEFPKKLYPNAVSQQAQIIAGGGGGAGPLKTALVLGQTQTLLQQQAQQQQQQQHQQQLKTPLTIATPTRRQIFWNTANISTTTKFVLDVQANQAFGFGTDGNERLASKHPELIRYLPDAEDREWLITQHVISAQSKGSRFLFLIHDEVCRLQQTNETYRHKTNIDLTLMRTFTVPEFMIQKMKLFFVDLNIKSRGLITNSFSVGAVHVGATTGGGGGGSGGGVNSHLRNALLQGMQTQNATAIAQDGAATSAGQLTGNETVMTTTTTPAMTSTTDLTGTTTTTATAATTSTAVAAAQIKPKASTLSSSHATLTALLNNSACNATTSTTNNNNNNTTDKGELANGGNSSNKLRK